MNNLNSILIEGNITRDPMSRQTPRGVCVTTFPIASSRYYRGDAGLEKDVSYFDIESWGKLAEVIVAQGKKGQCVRIVGRLRQDRWEGSDERTHSRIIVVAEHVEFRPEFKKVESSDESSADADVPPFNEMVDE
jgi:single-strand DNA-binding protein